MTRSGTSIYDDDFYVWTQEQAAAVRRVSKAAAEAGLDIEHVAQEIEDMGKRDLREVESFLTLLIEHLIKLDACPDSRDRVHWLSEIRHFQRSSRHAYTPGMRQLIDLDKIWYEARTEAEAHLGDVGARRRTLAACPYKLEGLLSDEFDVETALACLRG